ADVRQRTNNVKLRRAAAQLVLQPASDRAFPVLHARRDLGEQHVALREMCETLADFAEQTFFRELEPRLRLAQRRHWHESHRHGTIEVFRMPWIDFGNRAERSGYPPFRKFVAH